MGEEYWVPVEDNIAAPVAPRLKRREGNKWTVNLDGLHATAPHLVTPELQIAGVRYWQQQMVDAGYFNREQFERGVLEPTPEGRRYFAEQQGQVVAGSPEVMEALRETVQLLASLSETDLDEILRMRGIDPRIFEKGRRPR